MRVFDARFELTDRESIRALQLRRVREVLNHALATNPFYRQKLRSAGVETGDMKSLQDYASSVPMVTKQDFLEDQETDPPMGERHSYARSLKVPLFVCTTSGTSGQGQEIHAQTASELATTGYIYSYMYKWAGLEPGDQLFLTLPITMLGGGVLEYHGAVSYGLSVYSVGNYEAERKVALMQRFKPQAVLANTSYMGRLASLLDRERERLELKCMITGAEGAGIAYLERLEQLWGTPVFDRYGSTQAGNDHLFTCDSGIGGLSRPGMMHNIDPYVLLEVIDPETGRQVADGEVGEFVITSLYHLDTPLIRCRIGDWGLYHDPEYCPCGRPFSGIETASIFRRDDMRKVKGVQVWPKVVSDTVFTVPEIDEYQVVLTTAADGSDVATIRIMMKKDVSPARGTTLSQTIGSNLREKIGIHFSVEPLKHGDLDVGDWKAKRWLDERTHVQR